MKKVYVFDPNRYKVISEGNAFIYLKYDALKSFLRANFREEIQKLLLKPVKNNNEIEFWAEQTGSFSELNSFDSAKQEKIILKYNAQIYEIERKAEQFRNGTDIDDFKWGRILSSVFNPNCNRILSDGENIVVVWGWDFQNQQNYERPFDAFSSLIFIDPIISDINNTEEEINVLPPNEEEEITEGHPIEDSEKVEIKEESAIPLKELAKTEEETKETRRPIVPPTSNGLTQILDAFERFASRNKWLVVILVIILLLLLLKLCSQKPTLPASDLDPIELKERYQEIMPPTPKVRKKPIDNKDIIEDKQTKTKVVGNLVNIALKNKTDNFQHFAVDLKNTFPSDDYQIVYFDNETNRLQLQFPAEQRTTIKNDIRTKLNKYKLLIWDEAIFSSSKTFNDPASRDFQKFGPWAALNLPAAWDITTGDTSVIVAVIDNGFDLKHFELKSKFVKPYNVVTDSRVITFANDEKGPHGTHVAGLVGAVGNNSKGIIGAAPNCKIMPIQTAGSTSQFLMTDVVDAILYAIKNNADVINMSLGLQFTDEIKNMSQSQQENMIGQFGKDEAEFWNELFLMADENNVTIVTAAGNQNIIVGLDPMSRSSRSIKVAATDNSKQKAFFSNYFSFNLNNGSCLSAPGSNIYSSAPNGGFIYESGTSMASPLVAGIVALMKSVNKNISNKNIMRILHETGVKTNGSKIGAFVQADKAVLRAKNL